MQEAISLYQGEDSLINASDVDEANYLEKGFVCPLCHNTLFWASGYFRNNQEVKPCFKHHKNKGLNNSN